MDNLKELTKEQHKNAERSNFAKKLVSGKIQALEYHTYLYNMGFLYGTLENIAMSLGVLDDIDGIRRTDNIWKDYHEMRHKFAMDRFLPPDILDSVAEYIDYLHSIKHNKHKILAHIYVRHMGDLSGGQIIAKRLGDKFPTNFYQFDEDQDTLKEKLREKLNNDMAEEAMRAFDHAHYIFLELDKLTNDNSKPEGNSETSE